ncbi:tropomyosin-2-like [Prorops nasuta]|uniref:tropomyosin-2-like n=1 Tax=Prorops nasuta TaxID=863751 RepID=UPI0034D00E56
MSCLNYRMANGRSEQIPNIGPVCDMQYPHLNHLTSPSFTPRIKSPCSDRYYPSCSGKYSPDTLQFSKNYFPHPATKTLTLFNMLNPKQAIMTGRARLTAVAAVLELLEKYSIKFLHSDNKTYRARYPLKKKNVNQFSRNTLPLIFVLVIVQGRGDTSFSDLNSLGAKRVCTHDPLTLNYQQPSFTMPLEKLQAKLKSIEDNNAMMQQRSEKLVVENAGLRSQLESEASNSRQLHERIRILQQDLAEQRNKLSDELTKKLEKASNMHESGTSTNVEFNETAVQAWSVCRGCRQKLEGCDKEAQTIVITKSELDVLEQDMQTLKDAVMAREKAWDEAMEREQNYRFQIARLTGETITVRHLYESQQEELQTLKDVLEKTDSEARLLQKDALYSNKIMVKMHKRLKDSEEGLGGFNNEISEKEQRYIEEIVRRVVGPKTKPKSKTKKMNSPSSQGSSRGTISPGCTSDSVPEN